MLTARSVNPSQMPPTFFIRRASAQSSMISWRTDSIPPACLQRLAPDEHAAARRRRRRIVSPVHPVEGIEHGEKETRRAE